MSSCFAISSVAFQNADSPGEISSCRPKPSQASGMLARSLISSERPRDAWIIFGAMWENNITLHVRIQESVYVDRSAVSVIR
jgi:hypothetical protein